MGRIGRITLFLAVHATLTHFSPAFISSVYAREVTISWEGLLVPTGVEDPWLIGSSGLPFVLRIPVSTNAIDEFDQNVSLAGFESGKAMLSVGGQEANYIGDGVLDYTDNDNNLVDLVSFSARFDLSGETVEFASVAALAPSTFQFTELIESLPVFAEATTVDTATLAPSEPYAGIVNSGASVLVVPEPNAAIALITCIVILSLKQRILVRR